MQDWMGVILFGTEQNNTDSNEKHIQTSQELKVVTLDDLQYIRKLSKLKKQAKLMINIYFKNIYNIVLSDPLYFLKLFQYLLQQKIKLQATRVCSLRILIRFLMYCHIQ